MAQLTKDNVIAMKKATTVLFRVGGEHFEPYGNRRPLKVECIKRDSGAAFGESESVHSFNGMPCTLPRNFSTGYASIFHAQQDGNYQAFLKLIRIGDELSFVIRDNSNQYLEYAKGRTSEGVSFDRLYQDELCVTIKRGDKCIVKNLVLESSTTPQNSARMVQ